MTQFCPETPPPQSGKFHTFLCFRVITSLSERSWFSSSWSDCSDQDEQNLSPEISISFFCLRKILFYFPDWWMKSELRAWLTWYSGLKFSSSWSEQQELHFSEGWDIVFLFCLKEENTIVKLGSLVSQTEWLEISEKNSNVKSHRSKNQIRHSSLVKSIWKLQSVKTPKWSRNSTLHTHAVSSIIQSICQLSIQCPTPLQLG